MREEEGRCVHPTHAAPDSRIADYDKKTADRFGVEIGAELTAGELMDKLLGTDLLSLRLENFLAAGGQIKDWIEDFPET